MIQHAGGPWFNPRCAHSRRASRWWPSSLRLSSSADEPGAWRAAPASRPRPTSTANWSGTVQDAAWPTRPNRARTILAEVHPVSQTRRPARVRCALDAFTLEPVVLFSGRPHVVASRDETPRGHRLLMQTDLVRRRNGRGRPASRRRDRPTSICHARACGRRVRSRSRCRKDRISAGPM